MEYGSIFGHGAYLGPDFTADYLHRAALIAIATYGPSSDQARQQTILDFKTNRYDRPTQVLTFTTAQVHAFAELQTHYVSSLARPPPNSGLRPGAISDSHEIRQLVAFFAWSAWAASAHRPGLAYSYTNNWPPEPLLDKYARADTVVWSVLSLIALLGEIGLLLAAFGRWDFLGWHGREQSRCFSEAIEQASFKFLKRVRDASRVG